jgi:hypothetical protein
MQIPNDYKIIELSKKEKKGVYKFKFKITRDEKETKKDYVLSKFERLTKEYRETRNEFLLEEINELVPTIIENKWLTNDEIKNAIKSNLPHSYGTDNGCSWTKKLPSAE